MSASLTAKEDANPRLIDMPSPGIHYADPNAEVPNDIFAVLDISSWEELMGLLVPRQWIT